MAQPKQADALERARPVMRRSAAHEEHDAQHRRHGVLHVGSFNASFRYTTHMADKWRARLRRSRGRVRLVVRTQCANLHRSARLVGLSNCMGRHDTYSTTANHRHTAIARIAVEFILGPVRLAFGRPGSLARHLRERVTCNSRDRLAAPAPHSRTIHRTAAHQHTAMHSDVPVASGISGSAEHSAERSHGTGPSSLSQHPLQR